MIFPGAVRTIGALLFDPSFWPYLAFMALGYGRSLALNFLERRSPTGRRSEVRRALKLSPGYFEREYWIFGITYFWGIMIGAAVSTKGGEQPANAVVLIAFVCAFQTIIAGIYGWAFLQERYLWKMALEGEAGQVRAK